MRESIPTEKNNYKSINSRLIVLNVVLVILFFVTHILITSIVGTKTQEIDLVRYEKQNLRLQNEILTSDIDKSKSVASSEEIKEKYNLVEKKTIFLDGDNFDEIAFK